MAALAAPTRERNKAATRERLIQAAIKVVAEEGYRGASVDAIVTEAGVTKGALYSNFQDKDDLLVEVLRRQNEKASPSSRNPFDGLTLDQMLAVFAASFPSLTEGDVLRSLDVELWLLHSARARKANLPVMMAGLAQAADWLAREVPDAPVGPMDEAVLQAALVAGLSHLRMLLGPGTVRDDLVTKGLRLLLGKAHVA